LRWPAPRQIVEFKVDAVSVPSLLQQTIARVTFQLFTLLAPEKPRQYVSSAYWL